MSSDSLTDDNLPLHGLVVLDLTLARAGPTAIRHLADWGADVIRIQPPDTGTEDVIGRRDGADYQNLHRNKRVIGLDLKTPEGHAAFLRLAARADVLIENMRTQVKHRLKIAYEDLRELNPRLVYGSISGFGQTGPYAERAGVDQITQGMGGLMSVTGEPGRGPMRAGAAISDMAAGGLIALGVMMALFDRTRTGNGRWVSTSLLESQVHVLDFQAARFLATGEIPGQAGNEHPTVIPTGVFPTSDGEVNIAATSPGHWRKLAEVLNRPDWLTRPDWATGKDRARNRIAVHAAIAEVTATKPTAHWVEQLGEVGLPCGPIYNIGEMFSDPQVQHLGIAGAVAHPGGGTRRMLASPLNFDGADKTIRTTAPLTAEHTRQILAWLGYSDGEIGALAARNIIG
ncbi:MAG: CaiB/BaiF CoA-transferase family protein [Hyphomonadaceae bacterium]